MTSFYAVSILISCVIFNSPGDVIGTTWYDWLAYGQRLVVDDYNQAHIDWMKMNAGQSQRYCAWNARYANGSYYGETQASPSWSGYVQIDVTQDANPDDQRTVIAFHWNEGAGYYSWIDIDAGNLWGVWGSNVSSPEVATHIWPKICVASNNNIIIVTGNQDYDTHHMYLTTDMGGTWTWLADIDSCATLSHFVRASRNPGSNKVVFVHTQFITDTVASGQFDNDVYYMLSTDGGVTFGPHTNITNYQYSDSVRALCNVTSIFDNEDNIHIFWTGHKVTNGNYSNETKIFHWDTLADTITVVSGPNPGFPGGWWGSGAGYLRADEPQAAIDPTTGWFYCLWCGSIDPSDTSATGAANGEIFGTFSTDNGQTWSEYVNLTNTHSPGAPPGECESEGRVSCNPIVIDDSLYITYLEDKDSGSHGTTENPIYCWVFWVGILRTGIEEDQASSSKFQEPILQIIPNPFSKLINISFGIGHPDRITHSSYGTGRAQGMELRILDATGRVVYDFPRITQYALRHMLSWPGTDQTGHLVPAGVYFVELSAGDKIITRKVVRLR